MNPAMSWSNENGIAVATFESLPVNAISHDIRAGLIEAITRATSDESVGALIIACAGRSFFTGADIREFGKPAQEPNLPDVIEKIAASPKPVIAAMHGNVLGGGLEVAMACHRRLATAETRFGLPEVKLGLMPGARGTQLLPRLIGIPEALEMICHGEPISAARAVVIGLLDRTVDSDLIEAAKAMATEVAGSPPMPVRDRDVESVDESVIESFEKRNARRFRGFDAPPAIIASLRNAMTLPYAEAARRERALFEELRDGPQSAAMRHAFMAERQALKVPGLEGVAVRPVASVAVIGSGTMGVGIALSLLDAGVPVLLIERDREALDRGVVRIEETLRKNAASGRLSTAQADGAIASLTTALTMSAVGNVDLVIEAAFERMDVKQNIFAELDKHARPGAILATNTSYLDVDEIAASTTRRHDVIGLHFFSPANIMKLLEIVRGTETSPEVLATSLDLARRIGKTAVVSANAFGFIGNRMLAVRRREAEQMVLEGAKPSHVDRVLEDFGFAMGPFRMADLAGLDLGWNAEESTGSTLRECLNEAGRRGQKTSAGFYDYDDRMSPRESEVAANIIASFAADNDIRQHEFEDDEILDRLLWPMVNEGMVLLDEGIALRASDIDVVWLNGYGWPRWTGGPVYHAMQIGVDEVCRRLVKLGQKPASGWSTCQSNASQAQKLAQTQRRPNSPN